MPAFIHINLRVIDPARQANLAPRFRLALEEAGGKFCILVLLSNSLKAMKNRYPLLAF